jgi:type I restriction enzyme R subunit
MYLDKPMKDHTLLQAIARVNRPYPGKESGLIVDYIGVFENLQRALAFENETITKGLLDIEELRARFAELLDEIQAQLAPIDLSDTPGRTKRIIDHFFDEDRRVAFVRTYKDLQTTYETLAPDPFLRDYLDDYAFIVDVYQVVYNTFNPEAERRRVEYEILQKTDTLIRDRVSVSSLTELPVYPVHRDIAAEVKADDASERVKVTNLYRSLVLHVEEHQQERPYLISIGEEVERVIQSLRDQQISAQTALEQLTDIGEKTAAAEEEQDARDVDPNEFALYWVLKGQGFEAPEETARAAQEAMARFPAWPYDSGQERLVRLKLYALLASKVAADSKADVLKSTVDALLRMSKAVQT